ncbi:gamma-glutamylcyclotransferase [Pseudoscourfieldia marina]
MTAIADTNPILTSENRKNIFVPTNSRELMAMKPGPLKSTYLEAMGTEISNMERNGVYRGCTFHWTTYDQRSRHI